MAAKTRDYSKAEWDALDEKMEHPDGKVLCPRCENEISYKEIGNSISVRCLTDGCIFSGIRGL
jgi:hypothetical protein